MVAIIELVAKLVGFGLDWFVADKSKREELRKQFEAWIKRSSASSKESSDLKKEYDDMRKGEDGWKSKKKSQ